MADELPPPLTQPQQQQQKPRLNLHEIRNSDLVSRLLAATPPYLYSSPVGPHNFFFSEMLRSLVQARNSDQASNNRSINTQVPSSGIQSTSQPGRRPRKRAWSQQRTTLFEPSTKEYKTNNAEKLVPTEKPLELTTKIPHFQIPKYQKCNSPCKPPQQQDTTSIKNPGFDQLELKPMTDYSINMDHSPTNHNSQQSVEAATLTAAVPPSDLVLPPPPPMWYPPLYPPYGIDPLHFFIDLRVSGHIYDRKKENISPASNDNNNSTARGIVGNASDLESQMIGKHRHGSAFSVPPPRREKSPTSLALNLTSSSSPDLKTINSFNHTYDHTNPSNAKLDCLSKNTNYVLQNLPRIYTHLSSQSTTSVEEPANSQNSEDIDCKSDFDVHDDKDDRDVAADDDSNDVVIVDSGKNNKNY